MSAINYVVRPDGLYVFGDTAAYGADGVVGTFQSKVTLAKGFPGVIATTGNMLAGTLAKDSLAECTTCFDELIEAAQDHFQVDGDDIALTIGGYSDARGGFELWLGSSVMRRQFTRVSLDYIGHPPLSPEQWCKGFGRPMTSPAQIVDMEDFARTVLTLQREPSDCWRKENPESDFPPMASLVGGRGEIATITKDESSLKTIIEWPDEIDELINPAPVDWPKWRRTHAVQADPVPAGNAPRLNRRERLAAKARARKARDMNTIGA